MVGWSIWITNRKSAIPIKQMDKEDETCFHMKSEACLEHVKCLSVILDDSFVPVSLWTWGVSSYKNIPNIDNPDPAVEHG